MSDMEKDSQQQQQQPQKQQQPVVQIQRQPPVPQQQRPQVQHQPQVQRSQVQLQPQVQQQLQVQQLQPVAGPVHQLLTLTHRRRRYTFRRGGGSGGWLAVQQICPLDQHPRSRLRRLAFVPYQTASRTTGPGASGIAPRRWCSVGPMPAPCTSIPTGARVPLASRASDR